MSWLKKLLGLSGSGPAGSSASGQGPAPLAGERVLVADPSMTILKVVELTLAGEGCSVSGAATGDEAIASLAGMQPTVVLASTDLPGRSGVQVCEAVRRRPELASTVVLILAGAFEPPQDDGRLRIAGADGTLTKPFEPGALVARLRDLREKRPRSA